MCLNESLELNNGTRMPVLGLGVYKSAEHTKEAVLAALEAGYRHIDVASFYGNEKEVGEAIRESGIERKDVFVTTKLWNDDMRAGVQREAMVRSLEALGMDYVDLYLLHWPVAGCYVPSWKILEELYSEGKAKAIGVSNFQINHLKDLMANSEVVPAVNQIECHLYLSQEPVRDYCRQQGIRVAAWAPLGRTRVFEEPVIQKLAAEYGRTPAQIILRWEIQSGIIVIPKSVHRERIIANSRIFDFQLKPEDMAKMDGLNKDERFGPSPDTFDF